MAFPGEFSGPNTIRRRAIPVERQPEWVKMFDPPTESPSPTPELVTANNPVPEEMVTLGHLSGLVAPNTHDLRLERTNPIAGGVTPDLTFFTIAENGNTLASGGTYPAVTLRVPRGKVFHAQLTGSPAPPHTIHWHGIEPTSINDGVGHCSMEIGSYLYQWQPNFMGTYFYHCHRNTVMHFEFGLYGALIIEPPNWGPASNPVKRVACNLPLALQRRFPGFNGAPLISGDPFAMTVPYDVECLWVPDDRDAQWSALAGGDVKATFPIHGANPGVDDNFRANDIGFFAFNDFNATDWFVTGVPVPAPRGGVGELGRNLIIPPALNSGAVGSRIDIAARVNETILVRCIDAAYNSIKVTFPVPVVLIAWDGRALGVPPYGAYNAPIEVPANTPIDVSVARRFDALIRSTTPIDSHATIEFFDTKGGGFAGGPKLMTTRIPVLITS